MSPLSELSGVLALDFIPPGVGVHSLAYAPDDDVGSLPGVPPAQESGKPLSFGSVLQSQLQQLDGSLKLAEEQSVRLASGQAESLHRVMLDIEQARISLQLALQVRNRVIEAVQDLQRWQL